MKEDLATVRGSVRVMRRAMVGRAHAVRHMRAPPALVAPLASLFHIVAYLPCFQAEDGRREGTVTGVQTCALPICVLLRVPARERAREGDGERQRRRRTA